MPGKEIDGFISEQRLLGGGTSLTLLAVFSSSAQTIASRSSYRAFANPKANRNVSASIGFQGRSAP
jgi:hypothetical protein